MSDVDNGRHCDAIEEIWPDVRDVVAHICRSWRGSMASDQVDDYCNDIMVLLMEDGGRRLNSFDPQKSSLKTWLYIVARRHIQRSVKRGGVIMNGIDDLSELEICSAANPESELIRNESGDAFRTVLKKLDERDRLFISLLCEFPVSEAAKKLGIKSASAWTKKDLLKKKIQSLLALR